MYKGQVICIIILLFIGAFTFSKNRIRTICSRWFTILIVTSVWQLLFDILSVYTVNHLETVHPILNRVVHDFYMGLMLTIFYEAFKYLEAIVEEEIGDMIKKIRYSFMPLVITITGVVILPLNYNETPDGNYSHGPAAYMLYLGVAIYIVYIVRMLVKYWKYIPSKKKRAIIIALASELGVAVYQTIVPTSLITCLAITLLNLGIYLTVENPDSVLVELLKKETKRADVANQAKTDFLAKMSHEIRTPINAVLGMNEMILRESKDASIREYAMDVQGAAKSLLSIINDILDITKIEAGKLSIVSVEYAFSSMIHDVTNMISFKAKAKELEFVVKIDENIPSRLFGDDIRNKQILVNLLNNAVKYTHQGSVTLEAVLLPSSEENIAKIYFSIKDTGIGIKEEDIQKLYIPFERIEEKRNRSIEGTGIGMNITMQLLAMLGSRLEIKSEYNKGSEFSFVLCQPIVDAQPIGKLEEQIAAKHVEYDYRVAFEAPDARVLVVDDNEMNRKVFCSLLKDTRIQIEEAPDGRTCIEKVKKNTYDIIFMDHMMPEMDGIETLQVMKQMEDYPSKETPVVILTANAIVGAKEKYLKEGFDDFLSKPIDVQKLEGIIVELLDKQLVHQVEKRVIDQAEEEWKLSDLPIVNGLDWQYAKGHFNNQESMVDTVKFFVSTIEFDAKELEELYTSINEEDGSKEYCTKVHSMKNSASIIGIIPLAGMAKVLEDAAREQKNDVISQMHPIFIKLWLEYKEYLSVFADLGDAKKSAADYQEDVHEIFKKIKLAAEDMDIDALDDLLVEMEKYHYGNEQEQMVSDIRKAIINFDVEFLQSIS